MRSKHATELQPSKIAIMMIGEQPGDQEDKQGRPFVGPAGKLLDKALEEAEIDRSKVYVTNVVKHFKWEPRGKLRIHKKPTMKEINACRPWLDAELETLASDSLIVALGATAAQGVARIEFQAYRGARKGAGGAGDAADHCDTAPVGGTAGADG